MSSRVATIHRPMTALNSALTKSCTNFRTGRPEITETVSADGRWLYVHQDMPGTPWIVTDRWVKDAKDEWFGSLAAARRWTAEQPAVVTAASLLAAARREAFDARDEEEDDGTADSRDPLNY